MRHGLGSCADAHVEPDIQVRAGARCLRGNWSRRRAVSQHARSMLGKWTQMDCAALGCECAPAVCGMAALCGACMAIHGTMMLPSAPVWGGHHAAGQAMWARGGGVLRGARKRACVQEALLLLSTGLGSGAGTSMTQARRGAWQHKGDNRQHRPCTRLHRVRACVSQCASGWQCCIAPPPVLPSTLQHTKQF